jgi:hypothetical protein
MAKSGKWKLTLPVLEWHPARFQYQFPVLDARSAPVMTCFAKLDFGVPFRRN